MRNAFFVFLVIAALLLLLPMPAGAQEISDLGRDMAHEQEILDRLAGINPDAVAPFQAATASLDAEDYTVARDGFEQVLELAPNFPDALRRLSGLYRMQGNAEAALSYAEQAHELDPGPYNQASLAMAIFSSNDQSRLAEGLRLAKQAAGVLPDNADAQLTLALLGLVNADVEAMRQGTTRLQQLAPADPVTPYLAGIVAADDGKWIEADRLMDRSLDLGLPPYMINEEQGKTIRTQALIQRILYGAGYLLAGWLIGMVLLFVAGTWLSKATIRAMENAGGNTDITPAQQRMRTAYSVVIAITSAYFYISIPFLILLIIGAVAGVIYLFLNAGRMPIRFVMFIVIAAGYTLYAVVRSIFARVRQSEPGRPLQREDAPELWALAEEVAEKVGTRPVDAIYVTPNAGIAVTERGPIIRKHRGEGERLLILGMGALQHLRQDHFKSVLAHEYGHFSNRDTAGGNFAHQVETSIRDMGIRLVLLNQARWYNPAYWFVKGFYRIFLRITLGASRLQEILADRCAAMAYGTNTFAEGLTEVIRQSMIFDMQSRIELTAAKEKHRAPRNIYTLPPPENDSQKVMIAATFLVEMERDTKQFDSHPAPKDRIAFVKQLDTPATIETNESPVIDLLPNADQLQYHLMAAIRSNMARS